MSKIIDNASDQSGHKGSRINSYQNKSYEVFNILSRKTTWSFETSKKSSRKLSKKIKQSRIKTKKLKRPSNTQKLTSFKLRERWLLMKTKD